MNYYTKKRTESAFNGSVKSLIIHFIILVVFSTTILLIYFAPKLKDNPKPNELREQFFIEYGALHESFKAMQAKNFLASNLNRSPSFARKFGGFFKLESICDDYFDSCLWNNLTYKTLDGGIIPSYLGVPNVGQFKTRTGALYLLYSNGSEMWILIDVNGIKKLPNRLGLDTFAFFIDDDESTVKLMGADGTPFKMMDLYCNPYTSNKYNGMSCPIKATLDQDYFDDMIKILY